MDKNLGLESHHFGHLGHSNLGASRFAGLWNEDAPIFLEASVEDEVPVPKALLGKVRWAAEGI